MEREVESQARHSPAKKRAPIKRLCQWVDRRRSGWRHLQSGCEPNVSTSPLGGIEARECRGMHTGLASHNCCEAAMSGCTAAFVASSGGHLRRPHTEMLASNTRLYVPRSQPRCLSRPKHRHQEQNLNYNAGWLCERSHEDNRCFTSVVDETTGYSSETQNKARNNDMACVEEAQFSVAKRYAIVHFLHEFPSF
jgi:hypothetical protein